MNWQHLNILAATNYLRERIASGVPDPHAKEVYEGLLDVLDPSRIEKRAAAGSRVPERAARQVAPVPPTPDATSEPAPPAQVARPPAPVASRKAPAKKTAAKKKKASPPAKPARRQPARPARRAKPRRR